MQTFLPYRRFDRSATVLDTGRLGKQRVETLQVLRALVLPDYGWQRHPVVVMWQGRVPALVAYGLACVDAWTAQGRADTTGRQIAEFAPGVAGVSQAELGEAGLLPGWLGDGAVHLSHRSALVRKDPGFYRPVFGDVPDDLPYVWPPPDPPAEPVREPAGVPLWVVRGSVGDTVGMPLTTPSGRRSPKYQRQLDRFVGEVAVGDLVGVPLDGGVEVAIGRVTGEVVADGERLARAVAWTGALPRAAVRPPALLQDPSVVFRVSVAVEALEEVRSGGAVRRAP